ncbi:MAG: hypothetical protein PHW73_00310 [Atribacterota bacterium]|nr:hypothetical protein [Atribacterota bacterium]
MENKLSKTEQQYTIHSVVCSYCSKEIKTTPIDLGGELMHYNCANKAYEESCGDEGCATYEQLQECIP